MITIQQPIQWAIAPAVSFGQGGGVLSIPPYSEDLLVWLKGDNSDTQKLDLWRSGGTENFDMSKSACIQVNGTDEDGTTSIAHGTIVSSEGTATVTYSGTTLSFSTAGTFYNVIFSDGSHYRCAEGEDGGLISYDDTGEHTITWDGTTANIRGYTQDSYHGNAVDGWWESIGSQAYYPYDPSGDFAQTLLSSTAVDVFIYDTTKDSDGGAWRERCQALSWYNEDLNTATRGASRKFPAVVAIIFEATQYTIFDLTDPSAPMWRVKVISGTISSGAMLNGLIVVGTGAGVYRYNYISEVEETITA